MSVISNTTVLSSFAEIGALDMLRRLHPDLYLPIEVFQEIRDGLDEGYVFYSGLVDRLGPRSSTDWPRLTSLADPREIDSFASMPTRLHAGESACLAIARNRGWGLLHPPDGSLGADREELSSPAARGAGRAGDARRGHAGEGLGVCFMLEFQGHDTSSKTNF